MARAYDIFLSYRKPRRIAVKHLASVLEAYGYNAWWDDYLEVGENFAQQIEAQLREVSAVAVLWCSRSTLSSWVHDEALVGHHDQKLIPALIENIPGDKIPERFRGLETVHLWRWSGQHPDEWFEKFVAAVEKRTGQPRRPDDTKLRALAAVWTMNGYKSLADFPLTDFGLARSPSTEPATAQHGVAAPQHVTTFKIKKIETFNYNPKGSK